MSQRAERALSLKKQGYNCAQSVVCAYSELFGVDEKTAFRISEGFGGGMGGLQETCGAVTAMFMLAGLTAEETNLESPNTKIETYKKVKHLAQTFKNKNKSIICKELNGLTGNIPLRTCEDCIKDACEIFEESILAEILNTKNI